MSESVVEIGGDTETVVVLEDVIQIVSVGTQGPPGASGATGPQGPAGPQGPPGEGTAASYRHTQGAPDDTWTINHNLGFYPNVSVVDSAKTVVEGEVSYPDVNTVVINFLAAFSGEAYLS